MRILKAVPLSILIFVVCAVIIAFAPLVLNQYPIYILTVMFTLVVMGQAWNLMAGYGGLLSLGNQAFIGIGGYAMTLIMLHRQWSLFPALFIAGVAATLFAVVIMFPLFRLRDEYFPIGSLMMALAAQTWMTNWDFAGAVKGLNVPMEGIPSQNIQYLIALFLAAGLTIVLQILVHSSHGLALLAMRDDQDAAETAGVNTLKTKMAAVAFGAFFTGLAGGLVAMQLISIQPGSMFSPNWATDMLIMTTLGGFSTLLGPVAGAAIIVGLQQLLQDYLSVHVIIKALLLILVIRFMPSGVVPQIAKLKHLLIPWSAWGRRKKEVVEDGKPSAH